MREVLKVPNVDAKTVEGFGREWSAFTQKSLSDAERQEIFSRYFSLIDWTERPKRALDMGCGSGRWDVLVASRVGELVAVDASREVLEVAKRNVTASNVCFVQATPDSLPFPEGHFDFIFSLGVLHHLPDTQAAICSLVDKLSRGGTLLLYVYYALDNRSRWYRTLWKGSDLVRQLVSRLPFPVRYAISNLLATCVYWPLARTAKWLPVPGSWPLAIYADRSFYVMRTDALDRFGTRLEKRFTRGQIVAMLESAGLNDIRFSESAPYWICTARK